jgi:excisionase family DNA binding protein
MTTILTPADGTLERFLTAAEIGEHIGTTPRWIIEKAHSGDLPSYKLPGSNRVRFLLSEVKEAMRNGQ